MADKEFSTRFPPKIINLDNHWQMRKPCGNPEVSGEVPGTVRAKQSEVGRSENVEKQFHFTHITHSLHNVGPREIFLDSDFSHRVKRESMSEHLASPTVDAAKDSHLFHPMQNAGMCCLTRGQGTGWENSSQGSCMKKTQTPTHYRLHQEAGP